MAMRIRDADAAADAAACAAIYAPFVTGSATSFEELAPDAATFAERIARTAERFPYLVADADGRVAGFAYAGPHRARAAYRWAAEVSVYIDPDFRRRGVGRALYERLLGLLERQGLTLALAGITLPNDASVALHEAVGFRSVGVYRRVGFKAGAWRDVGWWQRPLGDSDGDSDGDSHSERPPSEPGPPIHLGD
jgi:L-amino acid N-acyltransferase YncA